MFFDGLFILKLSWGGLWWKLLWNHYRCSRSKQEGQEICKLTVQCWYLPILLLFLCCFHCFCCCYDIKWSFCNATKWLSRTLQWKCTSRLRYFGSKFLRDTKQRHKGIRTDLQFVRNCTIICTAVVKCCANPWAADLDRHSEHYKISAHYIHQTNQRQMPQYPHQSMFSLHVSMFISSLCVGLLIHQWVWSTDIQHIQEKRAFQQMFHKCMCEYSRRRYLFRPWCSTCGTQHSSARSGPSNSRKSFWLSVCCIFDLKI